jgi:hypothetical protein
MLGEEQQTRGKIWQPGKPPGKPPGKLPAFPWSRGENQNLSNISEGFEDAGNTGNETAIKMEHAKEALQTFDIRREWKIEDGLNTREKRSKACGSNLMAKAVNFRSSKVHFAGFRRKPLSARIWKTVLRCLKCSALSLLKSKYHLSR